MDYDDVMKLALERGFYFPSCEIYADAQAGFWEYGPSGVSLKNKFLELWRRELIRRDQMIEIDGAQIMSKSVFEASGHLASFADPIVKCIDTCHAFVFGYDLRTKIATEKTFNEFDEHIGFENLKILHLNDAKGELGSKLDRHYHIGLGNIGKQGMQSVTKMAKKKDIPVILETPIDDTRDDFENVRIAKELGN